MIKRFILISISLFTLLSYHSYGQGCSDAGFCTINSLKPINGDNHQPTNNQFKTGIFFGKADNTISAYGIFLEYNKQFNEKLGLDLKLTTLAQKGNDVSVFGLSDVFINGNYTVTEKLKLIIGAKIPLTDANTSRDNLPLPMDYQASLGTYDIILGVGYEVEKIQIVSAIQQPLTQNDNEFIANHYPINSKLRVFQSTNKFDRSGDILLRISYPISLDSKFTLTPSILPIYHLTNDSFTDEFNVKKEIIDSKGLTLNSNIYIDYEINETNIIQINMGLPLVVRDSRPDGLTRSFIANMEYKIKF